MFILKVIAGGWLRRTASVRQDGDAFVVTLRSRFGVREARETDSEAALNLARLHVTAGRNVQGGA